MKKLLVLAGLFFVLGSVNVEAQTMKLFTSFTKTVASTGTPEALTNTVIKVTSVTLNGYKDRTTANTGTNYVGTISTDDTQLFQLVPAGEMVIGPLPSGEKIDLSKIYVDVTANGDGVIVTYY